MDKKKPKCHTKPLWNHIFCLKLCNFSNKSGKLWPYSTAFVFEVLWKFIKSNLAKIIWIFMCGTSNNAQLCAFWVIFDSLRPFFHFFRGFLGQIWQFFRVFWPTTVSQKFSRFVGTFLNLGHLFNDI